MPPKRGRGGSRGGGRGVGRRRTRSQETEGSQSPPRPEDNTRAMNRDEMAAMMAEQIAAAIPTIVAQVNAGREEGPSGGAEQPINQEPIRTTETTSGCSYKAFMGCKPKEFHGTEGTIWALRWIDEIEAVLDISKCSEGDKVRYVSHSFKGEALEWWNTIIQGRGREEATKMPWTEFVKLMTDKYCPLNEMEKLQTEFLSLSMKGCKIMEYTQRFNALARLLPNLVTPEIQKVNRYIWGLDARVRSFVKAAQPATMKSAMELAAIVTDDKIRSGEFMNDERNEKRKTSDRRKHTTYIVEGSSQKKKKLAGINKESGKKAVAYQGTQPLCVKCKLHHSGECKPGICFNCQKPGHVSKDCKAPRPKACFECGSKNHFRNTCPKLNRGNQAGAQ